MQMHAAQNMGPRVEDWVRTLNMSKKLINLLKLPLQMPLEEFLEGLPGDMDAEPEQRLERYMEEREAEALLENEAEWITETSRFRMFGAGNRSSTTFAQQVVRTPLQRAAPLPSWRDEHATPQAVTKKRSHKSDSEETTERETKEDEKEPTFEMPADLADYDGSQGALPQEQADARWDALVGSEQPAEAQQPPQAEPPAEPVEQVEPVAATVEEQPHDMAPAEVEEQPPRVRQRIERGTLIAPPNRPHLPSDNRQRIASLDPRVANRIRTRPLTPRERLERTLRRQRTLPARARGSHDVPSMMGMYDRDEMEELEPETEYRGETRSVFDMLQERDDAPDDRHLAVTRNVFGASNLHRAVARTFARSDL